MEIAYILTSLPRSFGEALSISPSLYLSPSLPLLSLFPSLLPSTLSPLPLCLSPSLLLSVPHDVLLHRASVCRPLEMLKKTSGCFRGRHRNISNELGFSWEGCFCQHGCLEKLPSSEGTELSSPKLACCPLYLEPDDLNSSLGYVTLSRCCYL